MNFFVAQFLELALNLMTLIKRPPFFLYDEPIKSAGRGAETGGKAKWKRVG